MINNEWDLADMDNDGLKADKPFDPRQWLSERGWAVQVTGAKVIVGTRLDSEAYGPAPEGFVTQVMGTGYSTLEAIEDAIAFGNAIWF